MTGTSARTRWTAIALGVAVAAAGTTTVGATAGSAAADGPQRTAFVSVDLDRAVELDGWAYFLADDGEHGTEVWRTDGTPGGTALYADTTPGGAGSDTPLVQLYATAQGLLGTDVGSSTLYRVPAGTGTTVEVQGLDHLGGYAGTVAGDVALLWTYGPAAGLATLAPGADTAVPLEAAAGARGDRYVAATGALACYTTYADGELDCTDGTEAGTGRVADLGGAPSEPSAMVAGDRLVYFLADDGVHGRELWRTDGTAAGTARLTDLEPGDADAEIDMLGAVTVGDRLYVVASDPEHGRELWISKGTARGTHLVRDLADGPADSYLGTLTARGRFVFFTRGLDVWVTPGQSRAADLLTSYDGNASVNRLVVASGQLVYTRNDGVYQSGVTRGTQGTVLDRGVDGLLGIGRYVVLTVPRGDVTYLGHRRIRAVRPLDTFTTDRARVGGKPWIGRTVTARHGQWYPRFPDFSYRWTVGSRVLGSTGRTLELRPWMQGKRVRVRVTASKAGYEDASRTSPVKRVVRNPRR